MASYDKPRLFTMTSVSTSTLDDKDHALVEFSFPQGAQRIISLSRRGKFFKLIESLYSKKVNVPDKILTVVLPLSSILVKQFNYYL